MTRFSVSERWHEVGVRVALGARGAEIVALAVRQALGLSFVTCIAGAMLVLLGGQLVHEIPFQPRRVILDCSAL